MHSTHTELQVLFKVKPFYVFTSVYSTSFGGPMCLMKHTRNGRWYSIMVCG